jgi:purine nucleosidase
MNASVPLILDTDIGSDIDDAVALAYLLAEPRCELLGITTVTGEVEKRAALAEALCRAAGRLDIPVHCGAPSVLLDGPGQPHVPQYEALRATDHRSDWPNGTAIEFMRETVRSRPGEVTLLSIGPLTNVALLFALDPEVPALLKAWVSMAGCFRLERPQGEWNSRCDPLATAIAFRHRPPRRVHVGLDVTLQCRLSAAEVRRRFEGPLLGLVLRMAESWFRERDEIVFHDPLAAALVFQPDLCIYERGNVKVEPRSGGTTFMAAPDGADQVAFGVDAPRFFEAFFAPFGL